MEATLKLQETDWGCSMVPFRNAPKVFFFPKLSSVLCYCVDGQGSKPCANSTRGHLNGFNQFGEQLGNTLKMLLLMTP